MSNNKKILFSLAIPAFLGIIFLISFANTCERIPELILQITTDSIESLPGREYRLTGSIVSFGQEEITQHGFCWSETSNPTTTGTATQLGSRNSKGSFTSTISDLTYNTNYYVRAFVSTDAGTEYGNEKTFSTPAINLPNLTTNKVIKIIADAAQCGGNITDDGGTEVTARGVCWSIFENPTLSDSFTKDGTGAGTFTSTISGLENNTQYYVRAYATNAVGTAYGLQEAFTSAQSIVFLPTVTTTSISNITDNSAECGGNVTNDGGAAVTSRGVCWSTTQSPTISDKKTSNGIGTGSFTSSITLLIPNTTYYIKAYATNSVGTGYGEELSFTTLNILGEPVTDYDGNEYSTVQIGDQVWMAENLKVTHYSDGTAIPLVEIRTAWDALEYTDKAYCWYDNSSTNRDTYGGLYTWAAAMNGAASSDANPSGVQGVCPDGYHLPSDAEWKQLEIQLGMSQAEADDMGWRGSDEGGKLKETGFAHWNSPNAGATNSSGFTALPGSARTYNGNFLLIGDYGYWWCSSEDGGINSNALSRALCNIYANVHRIDNNGKKDGFSVRCVKDSP